MVLTQKALAEYGHDLPENCVVLADESLQIPQELSLPHLTQLPILRTAQEKVGKLMTANIVAVGAINALLGLVSQDKLREAVMLHVPKGTEALNERALEAGLALGGQTATPSPTPQTKKKKEARVS